VSKLVGAMAGSLAAILAGCLAGAGCGGGRPPGTTEHPAAPADAAADDDASALPAADPAAAVPEDEPPVADGATVPAGDAAPPSATESLVVCHCLTYPQMTGGNLVTIKDCYSTSGECAAARAERLRRRDPVAPPVPSCETESRVACGQAVFDG
jgi:hypothetical protein